MLMWLSDRRPAALAFAKGYLLSRSAPANTASDPKGTYSTTVTASGLTTIYTGGGVDTLLGAPKGDSHAPDLVGIAQYGVVYTGNVKKVAEHGGDAPADLDVPLVVSNRAAAGHTVTTPVRSTQIAPTILSLLGINPHALQAVQIEHTRTLPKR